MAAITMPTGISVGAKRVRPKASANMTIEAPQSAELTRTFGILPPVIRRAI